MLNNATVLNLFSAARALYQVENVALYKFLLLRKTYLALEKLNKIITRR